MTAIIYILALFAFISLFIGFAITISDFKKRYNAERKHAERGAQ
jgi:hypothetical protein